jgi:hypothetical protein
MALFMSTTRSAGSPPKVISSDDLVLTVQRLVQRVSVLEKVQAKAERKNNQPQWLSPRAAARISNGQYTEHTIKRLIDMAIADPANTGLIAGSHYVRTSSGKSNSRKKWLYKVLWPDFHAVLAEDTYNGQT